jgi:hypothetical protein
MERFPSPSQLSHNPSLLYPFGAFWQSQAVTKILADASTYLLAHALSERAYDR